MVQVRETEPEDRAGCVLNPELGSTTIRHDGVGINPSPATHHTAEQQTSTKRWGKGMDGGSLKTPMLVLQPYACGCSTAFPVRPWQKQTGLTLPTVH